MDGLLWLKKWTTLVVLCFVVNFAVSGISNATPLSSTPVSWSDFASAWALTNVQVLGGPFAFSDDASGKIVSIAYLNGSETGGKWGYAYLVSESSQSIVTVVALKPTSTPVSQNSDSGEDTCVGNSKPSRTSIKSKTHKAASQTYEWLLAGIVMVGYLFDWSSILNQANSSEGFGRENSQLEVLTSSPEPSVLFLLCIGFCGIARFRRKRK